MLPMPDKKLFNEEQVAAVTHGDGPLLIIAGAGTGKTTVITERIAYLIFKKKIPPSQILALTFTEKAASEMEERVDVIVPYGYSPMWICTFHSFCDRLLRQDAFHIGLNSAYKLLTEAESVLFLRQNLFALHLDYFRPLGNPAKFVQGMLQHFSRLKDEDISPEQYLEYAEKMSNVNPPAGGQISNEERDAQKEDHKKTLELAHAYKTYEDLKAKEGMMDFSDLISNTLKLFRIRKNVLSQYQSQFQYILIDEFQDTNFAQNELSILLAGKNQNITAVADDDQSIYRFRGSSVSNVIQFRKHFPKSKIITLTKNYRSTQAILDTAYKLIQHNNPDRLEVKEKIDKKLQSQRQIKGEDIAFLFSDRVENEAEIVVKKIQELMKKKQYIYKDFAILVRANDHAQPFVRAFERYKMPYQFLGPGQLFHQEEIKDLIAYLKVLYNYEDSVSLYRVLTIPVFHIPGIVVAALLNTAKKKNLSLFETISQTDSLPIEDDKKEILNTITAMIKRHLDLVAKESAGQILYYFLQDSGLLRKMIESKSLYDEKQTQNIAKFFDRLKTFETERDENSVFAVVDWIDLSMQMGESPLAANSDWSENNAINILTVHSSKGLEFPVVFIVNLIRDRFPSRERREQIPIPQDVIKEILPEGDFHEQEERRLFYVGITRAKDMAFLTAANFYGEGKRSRKLSPFIEEAIGKDAVEKIKGKKNPESNQLSLFRILPESNNHQPSTANNQKKITFLSYSQIQTFQICPLHYKLKYILKIPTPQTSALTFGTTLHAVLKEFYQRQIDKNPISIENVGQILNTYWVPDGYTSRDHEQMAYQRALKVLRECLEADFHHDALPLAVERPFQFYLEQLKIGGKIDRIDRIHDGTIEIIDYKTGGNIPDEEDLKKDLQLTIYALAASTIREELFNKKPEQVKLTLYYIEQNKKLTTTRTKEQLEETKSFLLKKADEIAVSDFRCNGSILCRNCEYKMLCTTSN